MTIRENIQNIYQRVFGVLAVYSFQINKAFADTPPATVLDRFSSSTPVVNGFGSFISKVSVLTDAGITEADFLAFVHILFLFFVLRMIVWTMFEYAFGVVKMVDIITNIFLILMVQVLMVSYNELVTGIWEAGQGVAGSIQKGMIGTSDVFFAPQFIGKMLSSITFGSMFSANPFTPNLILTILNMFTLSAAMLVISALSYVSVMWGFWGFSLAKLIGLLFVPTLLYERVSFLFDGWLRFYFGFIIYYIIARLNVVMVACSLAIYFRIALPFTLAPIAPIELPVLDSLFEAIGIFTFLFVGLLSLFSTGRFAGAIVAGAGGGGMGQAVLGAARAASKMAMK
jgi:hypothetical protein